MDKAEQIIQVLLTEYNTLRAELNSIFDTQKVYCIQGLVVIGALAFFVGNQWSNISEYRMLFYFVLMFFIPIFCGVTIMSSAATFIRGRQIAKYLARIEVKVNSILNISAADEMNQMKSLGFHRWLTADNNKKKRFSYRMNLLSMGLFFIIIGLSSLVIGFCKMCGIISCYLLIAAFVIDLMIIIFFVVMIRSIYNRAKEITHEIINVNIREIIQDELYEDEKIEAKAEEENIGCAADTT